MPKKLVSVIIPSYGRPGYLAVCIQSMLNQDYPFIEIIVVDDNGKGTSNQIKTEQLIIKLRKDHTDHNIKYIVHTNNRGGAAARNTGVSMANGEIIALLDNDDLSLPARISMQVKTLLIANKEDPSIKACLCLAIKKKHGTEIDRDVFQYKNNYLFELLAIQVNLGIGSCGIFYKSVYNELQGFDERFTRNQDIEFMIRYYEKFNTITVNEHLVVINIDDRSNIPSYQKIKETKHLLLSKYKSIIEQFTPKQKKEIYRSHSLEIAKVALWNKNIGGFLKGYKEAKLSFSETIAFMLDVFKKAFMHLK